MGQVKSHIAGYFTESPQKNDKQDNASSVYASSYFSKLINNDQKHIALKVYGEENSLNDTGNLSSFKFLGNSLATPRSALKRSRQTSPKSTLPQSILDIFSPAKKPKLDEEYLDFPFFNDKETIMFYRNSKIMIILRGAPGSGKSTVANNLQRRYVSSKVCSADFFFIKDGVYKHDKTFLKDAHAECQMNAIAAVQEQSHVVIIDNTNVKMWEMNFYFQLARTFNYIPVVVEPQTPWKTDLSILVEKNIHNVRDEIIEIKLQSFETLAPLYYGWFLNEVDSASLYEQGRSWIERSLQVPEFRKDFEYHAFSSSLPNILEYYEIPNDGSTQISSILHCTSKYIGKSLSVENQEYMESEEVAKAVGRVFDVEVVGFVLTPRTFGARIKLSDEQLKLWGKDDEEEVPHDFKTYDEVHKDRVMKVVKIHEMEIPDELLPFIDDPNYVPELGDTGELNGVDRCDEINRENGTDENSWVDESDEQQIDGIGKEKELDTTDEFTGADEIDGANDETDNVNGPDEVNGSNETNGSDEVNGVNGEIDVSLDEDKSNSSLRSFRNSDKSIPRLNLSDTKDSEEVNVEELLKSKKGSETAKLRAVRAFQNESSDSSELNGSSPARDTDSNSKSKSNSSTDVDIPIRPSPKKSKSKVKESGSSPKEIPVDPYRQDPIEAADFNSSPSRSSFNSRDFSSSPRKGSPRKQKGVQIPENTLPLSKSFTRRTLSSIPANNPNKFHPTSGKGSRAHFTLGVAPEIRPVTTGLDLIYAIENETLALEAETVSKDGSYLELNQNANEKPSVASYEVDGGTVRNYGNGIWVMYPDQKLVAKSVFTVRC